MIKCNSQFSIGSALWLLAMLAITFVSGCGDQSAAPGDVAPAKETGAADTVVAKNTDPASLPKRGRQRLAAPPAKAAIGMIYINQATGREYIFDGADWVPHDKSIDSYQKPGKKMVALDAAEVCDDGDPACTPTGAHGGPATALAGHYAFDCKVCHKVGGRLSFDKNGPAYKAGNPAPAFNATTKTCLNVGCHGVAAGTYVYYFPGGDGEPELRTASYGGSNMTGGTPSWYATGASACTACHGNPPKIGATGVSNAWHSGQHAGAAPTAPENQCQFCHPDASSPNNGQGDTITNLLLHANGVVNVQARFRSSCFGCH